METRFTARHFNPKPELRAYVAQKLGKLERFYDGITDVHIVLAHDQTGTDDKLAEVSLTVFRNRISAKHAATTFETAIDECVERLRSQLLKYKDRLHSNHKDAY
jgi:putative sigma-54 modulation protein